MKHFLLLTLSIALFSCSTEVKEDSSTTSFKDSLMTQVSAPPLKEETSLDSIIVKHKLVDAPFTTRDETAWLRKMLPKQTERNVELKPNIHDETITDTITTLYWGKSYLETISNAVMERPLLNCVIIKDNNIVLKNNIRIGQDLKTVCDLLHLNYNSTKHYKFIELTTPEEEAESYLTFYFKDNVLESIVYSPYTG